ncbi:HAMP domain-containing protein [Paenibacillus mesophilus]|uniref:sensor histidine kinase n=1 Tax=Paenibacillus mesophilus TaxID=2582849 RepID=UPI00110D6288|nr:ATP-binding protein [Paenibacillus mesophilus]TMV50909.1 HAMP domain-containing protein [Paenibacillus mesophilus]
MKPKLRLPSVLKPHSLGFQLLSRSLLVLAVILLFIGIFQYVVMREFLFKNKAETMQNQLLSVPRDVLANPDGIPEGNGRGRGPMFFLPDMTLAVIDLQGNITNMSNWPNSGTPPKLPQSVYDEALKKKMRLNYKITRDDQGNEQLVVLQQLDMRGRVLGVVQLSTSTAPLNDVAVRQLFTFISLSLLAMILGLLSFIPVMRRTLVPLSKIVDTVGRIDAGSLDERLPARQGQMEVDRLALSFNGMLERLEASFAAEKEAKEQMRRFIADASHELRTPLTSIHGFLEVLLRGAMNQPNRLHKALTSMHSESERINKLVRDLLLLAKMDRAPIMEMHEGALDRLIKEMEPQLRLLAGNREVALRMDAGTVCLYDADKMKQVVLNLFHNAVQHTDPEKGRIAIALTAVEGRIELSVTDNGAGIPEEHLPYVFDRFYRSESSRTRKAGGAGLGLSITRSIVEAHGGTIRAESRVGEGSVFAVSLPDPPPS